MNAGYAIIIITAAIAALLFSVKTYARQQVTINDLKQATKKMKAEIERLEILTIKLQEIDDHADEESDKLDADPDSELDFMQN